MHEPNRFQSRAEAGKFLADKLIAYRNHPDAIVLGLPRGGVPVAFEIAKSLTLPLDVFLVRKLGVPGHEELAMGSIASNSEPIFQAHILDQLNISSEVIANIVDQQSIELKRREDLFRNGKKPLNLMGKVVIVVDDGLATGSTMVAALRAIQRHNPARIIVAVPVGSHDAISLVKKITDEIICLKIPDFFYSVGFWYEDFQQTTDAEVLMCLENIRSI